ncbi:hypothetical protein HWV62_35917 [Athelia sp. TMB]|nr:hypothetical protein HWV62_35917 [Athelia sp. TMB]
MSCANRKRAMPAGFDWEHDSTDTDSTRPISEPRTTRMRHHTFNLDATGTSTSSSDFTIAPASPEKSSGPIAPAPTEYDDMPVLVDVQEESEGEEDGEECEAARNPQYLQHRRTMVDLANVAGLRKTRKKRTAADDPTAKWKQEREEFLLELIRLEGLGESTHDNDKRLCSHCNKAEPARWNGSYFERSTLKSIGLRIQLGHARHQQCSNPVAAAGDDFVIIDGNGIHRVGLDDCGCTTAPAETVQLLRARLYPATVQAPKTAATFNVMEFFHVLSFDSKASAFEFFHTLTRRTDNTGTMDVPDRYVEFLRMIRQWRNLKMMKRAARGHAPGGMAATKEGECAVICPACPHPGKNLPEDWRNAPVNARFIYELFLAADANFRMVRRKVSSESANPTLSPGLSYFCEMSKYREHLAKYGDQKETHSMCVKHHAVGDANTSRFANLAASGIGTVDCTQHMMKRPNSVGELQKGERYTNMDYIFFSSVSKQEEYVRLVMSYDIVCQWSVHLWDRMLAMPGYLQIDREGKDFVFLVPKFHLPAHVQACQTSFSFNLTCGVGRTDGEAPERGWSNINPVSSSVKAMGPASYRETIDDHFGDWNHQRVTGFSYLLLRKLRESVEARAYYIREFSEFSGVVPAAGALEWITMVKGWEMQSDLPNPFVSMTLSVTQHGVRLALAELDGQDLQQDNSVPVHENVTPGIFIAQGLDLEIQQVRLKVDTKALDSSATSLQLAKIQERKTALKFKVKSWIDIQQLYMPEVTPLRSQLHGATLDSAHETPAYDISLHLPSSLPSHVRASTKLSEYEFRLRTAQAHEALDELRRHLLLRTHMWKFKDKNLKGQRANTRAGTLATRVQSKVNVSASKYIRARNAIASLAQHIGAVGWDTQLKELLSDDVRAFTDETEEAAMAHKPRKQREEQEKALGEGKKKLSWIWKVSGVGADMGDSAGLHEAMRIEWCKSRARAMRWSEEVLLLREEMRRVIAFLHWHADWWISQGDGRTDVALLPEIWQGLRSYAARQAAIRKSMAAHFDSLWTTAWTNIADGEGRDNELLELEPEAAPFLTSYPSIPPSGTSPVI